MATDTLMEQALPPCESASIEQLDKMLRQIRSGEEADLKRFVRRTASDEIAWEAVRHLRIVGNANVRLTRNLNAVGLSHGFYSNDNDNWLLIVAANQQPEDYVDNCSTDLESLGINDAGMSTIPGLENLSQLTSLNLSGCKSLTELPGLEKLTQLTSLNLVSCQSLTKLPGLKKLTQLTSLDLSGCKSLKELPGLEKLTQLTSLDLSGCEFLTHLPGLEKLTQLTSLNLSVCRSLTELPGLKKLTQLTSLDLSMCRSLTKLPGLEKLTQLTSLNFSGCDSKLPDGIRHLQSLRRLDLCMLYLRDLPDWLPEIAEGFNRRAIAGKSGSTKAIVYLGGTTVEAIPDMSIFDQPYEVVAKWFEERKLGRTHPLNEIKVVFLGDGEAGKSHTIARLMNGGGEPDYAVFDGQSTPGIVIRNKEYPLDDRKITVHYWDFGGQEIMHSMHRIFLTGRTMYVVLLNARDDTQSDRAKYWLHNVKSFAPDAPVLLVLNKIDQNPNASVDEKDLRARYEKLTRVVRLSALMDDQEKFNREFTAVLLEEIQKTGFLDAQWPISWTKVKDALEHMTSHYIKGDSYLSICEDCSVDRNQKDLLHWFNDLGVSFCCDGEDDYTLEDYVILRPDWITNALYIILFNPLAGASNGLIPHRSIYSLLRNACRDPDIRCTLPSARYDAGDIQYVLGIMRKFSLSFPHGNDHEFIPMLCQQNSTVDVHKFHEDEDTLEFNMDFDYLPNNLLHRLMVERHPELDMDKVWRTGARFRLPELWLSAVVVIDGNTLRFFIQGADPMHRRNTYLTMLKAHVDRIVEKMGLKPPTCRLIYKLDGKRAEFGYDRLLKLRKRGRKEEYCEALDEDFLIEDIMNQSAPDNLNDERKLLDRIVQACGNLQDDPIYRLIPNTDGSGYVNGHGMEDLRNRRIRDNLINAGYRVSDQSQRGVSGTGKSVGELDILVFNDSNEPWTIIEALRISGKEKSDWNRHLEKLSGSYNTRGYSALYLLTYVDTDTGFTQIWESYVDHVKHYHPGQPECADVSCEELRVTDNQYIKVAKCRYSNTGDSTTVYHIFARIPPKNI